MTISPLLLRLPAILRAAGCEVVEHPGWRDRGRPWSFVPRAIMLHHDGSPVGPAQPAEVYARFLFETGRESEGIPAPLCQVWIDFFGRWWIGAAGGANHAGFGGGWGVVNEDFGNAQSIGVEMDNTTGEPTTADQYEALHRGLPALFKAFGWDPAYALTSHKEYAPGRKFDPDDIDMSQMRRDVAELMAAPIQPPPEQPPEDDDDMPKAESYSIPPAPRDADGNAVVNEVTGRPMNAFSIALPKSGGEGGVKFGNIWLSIYAQVTNSVAPIRVWGEQSGDNPQPQMLWPAEAPNWFRTVSLRTRTGGIELPNTTHGVTIAHDSPEQISVLIEYDRL